MSDKIKILFVDDEPVVLQSLRRMLHPVRQKWECRFATGGEEALKTLAGETFDLIVTDMRMPGMNGAELLGEVKRRHPQTIRFILSGQTEDEAFLKSVGVMHQFLSKPCTYELLTEAIDRAFSLRGHLDNPDLRKIVLDIGALPSLPEIYFRLMEKIKSPEVSVKEIADIISRDAGLTAKILQLVNSAFFGYSRRICDIQQAVLTIGLEMIQALALSCKVFSTLENPRTRASFEVIWRHCLRTASLTLVFAEFEKLEKEMVSVGFTAGLLHDIGECIMVNSFPEKFREMQRLRKETGVNQLEAEMQIFKATHQEIGAYLCNLWGLPNTIIEAVAFHHNPSASLQTRFSPLTVVHVATTLAEPERGNSMVEECLLDEEYLRRLGVLDRVPVWRSMLREKLGGRHA